MEFILGCMVLGLIIGMMMRKGGGQAQGGYARQPQYTRVQKGHSLTKHILFGWIVGYIYTIYITISPNHYWHV